MISSYALGSSERARGHIDAAAVAVGADARFIFGWCRGRPASQQANENALLHN